METKSRRLWQGSSLTWSRRLVSKLRSTWASFKLRTQTEVRQNIWLRCRILTIEHRLLTNTLHHQRLPVRCVPTGVKHLHHAAERFDIGVYFEANGHGTVLFSSGTQELLASHEPTTPAQSTALNHLRNLVQLINQTVGDAISDILLVETVLAHRSYSGLEWDSLYVDLPNRLVRVIVEDRHAFQTEDAERQLVSPKGLQSKIDDFVRRYDGGRSFVIPSGTEDVVRVYAEAAIKSQADGTWYFLFMNCANVMGRAGFPCGGYGV
jgi:phosphomannomutase